MCQGKGPGLVLLQAKANQGYGCTWRVIQKDEAVQHVPPGHFHLGENSQGIKWCNANCEMALPRCDVSTTDAVCPATDITGRGTQMSEL